MKFNGIVFELETMEHVKFENGETDYIIDTKQFLIFKNTSYDKVSNMVKALVKQVMKDGRKDNFTVYLYGLNRQYKEVDYIKFVCEKLEMKYMRMEYNNEKERYERVESGYIDSIDRYIIDTIEYIKENIL